MSIPPEITDLIQGSGNNFHAKVARWLVDNGWHVIVSPYYLDQTIGKSREIDLIAEKVWPVNEHTFKRHIGDLVVRLFIECKYLPSYSVFWFADKDMQDAKKLVCLNSPFRMDNKYTDKHHYLSNNNRVAKLFTSSNTKSSENEPIYKALNQVLNGMVSLRGAPVSIPAIKESGIPIKATLEYPIIVGNSFSQAYKADFYNDASPEIINDNFQLEVRYAYVDKYQKQQDDYFLIDIVEYDRLTNFFELIDQDAKAGAYLV